MELNNRGLINKQDWLNAGYQVFEYDREKVISDTKERPFWIHFGAGNIFRAFQANVAQELLNRKIIDRGVIVAEGFDVEIIEKMNRAHDDLSILVTLKADGSIEKKVIGSVCESCILDSENEKEFDRLKEIFRKDSLQMATFTITEKGYAVHSGRADVAEDLINGPYKPKSYIGKVTALLYERYLNGKKPIAMVSMDNCSHNGDKLFEAVSVYVDAWVEKGLADAGFKEYVENPKTVSFPWTMIDKITPRPDESVEKLIEKDGICGLHSMVTSKNTYVAPFVNAEECEYLVIEDAFPNGREALEKGGIIFTDKQTVDKVEKMKVCTCLNPLHTTLAVFGCLLGYKKISDEMKDEELKKLVEMIGYQEGLPVVINPLILDPKEFIDTVLQIRIPNPFMPDTPQRIATDTSQKLAIRFGETIKKYWLSDTLDVKDLKYIPLVFAGWLRYLLGIDDFGNEFELSPDPMLETVCPIVKKAVSKESVDVDLLDELLENEQIFGINLKECGLDTPVCDYFKELLGKGAVRQTLKKYLGSVKKMKKFMDQDFLLSNDVSKKLYHNFAENMPILDYHCHISPKEIYEDKRYDNITQVWLGGDHYKWRQMRTNGVDEKYISGDASDREKFQKWAETLEMAIGNPLYHWSHLELQRYFGYEGYLNGETAQEVWDLCNQKLQEKEMSVRGIIQKSNVKLICTTDDPIDSLEWHKKIKEDKSFDVQVLPAWRPDKAMNIEKEDFNDYLQKLSEVSEIQITDFKSLIQVLSKRMDVFEQNGCKVSDHGLEYIYYEKEEDVEAIFAKKLAHQPLTSKQIEAYKTAFMCEMAKQYHHRGWVMQLHYGAQRDLNQAMYEQLGPDTGFDAINNIPSSKKLANFLNTLEYQGILPKTILYSLNPNDNEMLATTMGCFQKEGIVNKIQHGSAWWFNDHHQGMKNQMISLANLSLLGNFIGMLTDSRNFLSYTRHEYFRRILCDLIGTWVENGEYPEDEKALKRIIQGISYENAVKYFEFDL